MSLASLSVHAEIYKYRGKDGGVHFTDRPMSGNYRLIWRNGPSKSRKGNYSLAKMRENKSKFTPMIETVAKELRLHPGLLHAMVRVESAYNPKAISKKGAQGLMQLMPATASRYGVNDSYDPKQNLEGGARYLSDLLTQFEYDIRLALAVYNAGENAVKRYGNKIPPYKETMNYVDKVMGEYERNRLAMLD
ncbi:MAG: lytic transglycosylase domain-containing protein [Candidatus Thiodiazotropha sp. (ex Gloverina cf. vestifex)]|nr:lytic transglycosylase domain-containing protein [Candidatus Thiodiazotropha sp. (ex Gloverina cf. vestifex)]